MTDEELRILAWTLLGEAGGEGTHGMEAVAHVIRNRAMSGRYPSNPAAVALQQNSAGVSQFSTWNPISMGGNIPRARYPVNSPAFAQAMGVVERVFGDSPGHDPTFGATHYYAPRGMPGGDEPYWWNSEAPFGGKKIGRHVFALKRDPLIPVPVDKPKNLYIGNFPSQKQMDNFLGPRAPLPAQQSAAMRARRGNVPVPAPEPATQSERLREQRKPIVAAKTTYDPVQKMILTAIEPITGPASQPKATAKEIQTAARRAVLSLTNSFAGQERAPEASKGPTTRVVKTVPVKVDPVPTREDWDRAARMLALEMNTPSMAADDRAPNRTVTLAGTTKSATPALPKPKPVLKDSFAGQERAPVRVFDADVRQPNGSVNNNKDQTRLVTETALDFVPDISTPVPVAKEVAPLPRKRPPMPAPVVTPVPKVQMAPVKVVAPKPAPLSVAPSGANPIVSNNNTVSGGNAREPKTWSPWGGADNLTKPTSELRPGDRYYDPDTNTWERKAPRPTR